MKQKPTNSFNPAENGLTNSEYEVYKIVSERQVSGKLIKVGDIAAAWGGKNRSYTYRVLRSLMDKGFVEQYKTQYYKLAEQKGNQVDPKR